MTLLLRPYTPDDFGTLYAIDQACYPPGIAYSRRTLRWFLRRPGAECVVAEDSGQVVGFVLAHQEGPGAHLVTMDVLTAHRRMGIGAALLNNIERTLASRGVQRIELETATDNGPAVAFWRKHGYLTRGVIKRYYLDSTDAYSMHKLLTVHKEG